MIKRIELVNFMSHERTVIEPAPGLTVLIGPNNCGKSAFVSALQILCHNAKSSYVMRHGEKQCRIVVETDEGHIVEWTKKKSGSPYYLINGEKFDRLRGKTPSTLHDLLRLPKVESEKDQFDVHFGEQKSPVFLLNDSGKAAAEFFASSSDAIRLVEMQELHKTRVRDEKRDLERLKTEKTEIERSLELLEPVENLDAQLQQLEQDFANIESEEEAIKEAAIIIQAIEELQAHESTLQQKRDALQNLTPPPVLGDEVRFVEYLNAILIARRDCELTEQSVAKLADVLPPPLLENSSVLEQLTKNLMIADKTYQRAHAVYGALIGLEPTPNLEDVENLQVLVGRLAAAKISARAFSRKQTVLDSISPPPVARQVTPLQELLLQLQKPLQTIAQTEQLLQTNASKVHEIKTEIAAWAESNPACPTCGSKVQLNNLLEHAEGHQHG